MIANGIQFPRRWYGVTISTDLDVIWGMSANMLVVGVKTRHWIGKKLDQLNALSCFRFTALIAALYVALCISRAPGLFIQPRFWAEEATLYFDYALQNSFFSSLTASHLGYYSVIPNISGWLAAQLPLVDAPIATLCIALAVQVWVLILLVNANYPGVTTNTRRFMLVAAFVFGFPQTEVWLTTINSQWYLMVATAIVLSADTSRGIFRWLSLSVLGIAGLSGPGSVFMAPLFCIRAALERTMARSAQAAVMVAVSLIQITIIILNLSDTGAIQSQTRSYSFDIYPLLLSGMLRSFVVPVLGPDLSSIVAFLARGEASSYHQIANPHLALSIIAQAGIMLLSVGMCALITRSGRLDARWLVLAALLASILTSFGALGDGNVWTQLAIYHHRYTFPATTIVGIAICLTTFAGWPVPWYQRIAHVFLATYFIWAVLFFVFGPFLVNSPQWRFGPNWRTEVREWQADPNLSIELWPAPWRYDPSLVD